MKKEKTRHHFHFLLSSLSPRAAKAKPRHALVDAPPRGQEARPRPPHERLGEGRGTREFGEEERRKERVGWVKKKKGDALPFFLLFDGLSSQCFFFFSREGKKERASFSLRGRILAKDAERAGKRATSFPFLVVGSATRWMGLERENSSFPLSGAGSPCVILSPSRMRGVVRVEENSLDARLGANRRNRLVEPSIDVLGSKTCDAASFSFFFSSSPFSCSSLFSTSTFLFSLSLLKQKSGARLRPREAHVRRPGGKSSPE